MAVILLFHIKRHLLSVSGSTEHIFTEPYIYIQPVAFLSGQKRTEFACPAVNFDWLMKNKLMWILHI